MKNRIYDCVILFVCISFSTSTSLERQKAYLSVLKEIEDRRTDSLVPPFPNDGLIPLEVGFEIHRVLGLETDKAALTISGILIVAWYDSRLAWNNSVIDILSLNGKDIWLPRLDVSTAVQDQGQVIKIKNSVLVSQAGRASLEQELTSKISCNVDVKYFPRDIQHCVLLFKPPLGFRQLTKVVMLPMSHAVDSSYIGEEWFLLGHSHSIVKTRELNGSNAISEYDAYELSILLARNNGFYVLTLLIPSIMLSGILLIPFIIPPKLAQPKLIIPVSTFVSINVYMILLEKSLPHSTVLPILGVVYAILLCAAVLTEMFQVCTVKLYNCRIKKVPRLLSFVYFKIFSAICCYTVCHGGDHLSMKSQEEEIEFQNVNEEVPFVDRAKSLDVIQKQWRSLSRINDRFGLMICSIMLASALSYLTFRCYIDLSIPTSYRGPTEF